MTQSLEQTTRHHGGDAVLRRHYYYDHMDDRNGDGYVSDTFSAREPMMQQLHQHLRESVLTPYSMRTRMTGETDGGWLPKSSTQLRSSYAASYGSRGTPSLSYKGSVSAAAHTISAPREPTTRRTERGVTPPGARDRRGRTHSYFGAVRLGAADRYRDIADLAAFMATGEVNERTRYFQDPMQRRLAEAASSAAAAALVQQRVIAADRDPRFVAGLTREPQCDEQQQQQRQLLSLPNGNALRKAFASKLKYAQTTGLVKPYAIGRSHLMKFDNQVVDQVTMEDCMDAYITTMRCQRPTKGLYTYQ